MSADVIRAGEVIEGEVVAPPFDYAQLGAETRIVIQQAATEIRDELDVMRRSAAKIGQRLVVVRERLKPLGQWGAWLDREFGWSDQTALNYISVAELGAQNPKFLELESQFARTALTELARDTTPPAAREEAIRRAAAGERITPGDAKELVQAAKAEGVGAAALAELAERGWQVEQRGAGWTGGHYLYAALVADTPDQLLAKAKQARRAADERRSPEADPLPGLPDMLDRLGFIWDQQGKGGPWRLIDEANHRQAPVLYTTRWSAYPGECIQEAREWIIYPANVRPTAPKGWAWEPTRNGGNVLKRSADGQLTRNWASYQGALNEAAALDQQIAAAPPEPAPRTPTVYEDLVGKVEVAAALIDAGKLDQLGPTLDRLTAAVARAKPQLGDEQTRGLLGEIRELRQMGEELRRGSAPPPAPTPLPGVTPGRQPYGSSGSGRHVPIVPHVLIIGDRRISYAPAPLIRAETIYDTAETVRVKRPDGREETKHQHHVYCIPDDAAWATLTAAHEAYAARLTDLANALRQLGRYDKRLEAAGGLKKASNPLTATVIGASDPDARVGWVHDPWYLTYIQRKAITRHTAKMLFYHYNPGDEIESSSAQDGYFVCPDDESWARVEALHRAAQEAQHELTGVLNRLGLYKIALADGRYTPAPPTPVELPDHLLPSPVELADVEIDADDFWEVAPERYAEILRGLDDQALGLLAAALWSRGDLDWVDAERDDLVEALAQELAELLSAELDGANPRRIACIARLLGAGVPS